MVFDICPTYRPVHRKGREAQCNSLRKSRCPISSFVLQRIGTVVHPPPLLVLAQAHHCCIKKAERRAWFFSFSFWLAWLQESVWQGISKLGGGGLAFSAGRGSEARYLSIVNCQLSISYHSFKFCSFSVCCYVTTFALKYTRQPCLNKCVARPLPPRPNYRTQLMLS